MNQGRIWCVVKPTVGLPLFLGGVATISLLVHASVMTNTNWMARYWQGSERPRAAELGDGSRTVAQQATPSFSITVAPGSAGGDGTFTITVAPTHGGPAMVQSLALPRPDHAGGSTLALATPTPD